MKLRIKEETKQNALAIAIAGIGIVSFYFLIVNFEMIKTFLKNLFNVLMPFILGFFLAFILSNITECLEKSLMKNWKIRDSIKRKLAVALSLVILIVVLALFIYLLVNQVAVSVQTFLSTMNVSMDASTEYLSQLIEELHLSQELFDWIVDVGEKALVTAIELLRQQMPAILSYSFFVVTQVLNFFIALIVATYILLDKEKFYLGTKKFCYSFLKRSQVEWLIELTHISSRMFNNFIVGKMIDSLIIGILCYIGMSILKLDFAVLISFIVGVTNMIPIFGPFIGAVPGFIILLITSPQNSLTFVVWVIILQQFDGNILGPKILGGSMGLPTVWIMFAIIFGGAYFGFIGMFLGVPVFSIFYYLIKEEVGRRLKEKRIKVE